LQKRKVLNLELKVVRTGHIAAIRLLKSASVFLLLPDIAAQC